MPISVFSARNSSTSAACRRTRAGRNRAEYGSSPMAWSRHVAPTASMCGGARRAQSPSSSEAPCDRRSAHDTRTFGRGCSSSDPFVLLIADESRRERVLNLPPRTTDEPVTAGGVVLACTVGVGHECLHHLLGVDLTDSP